MKFRRPATDPLEINLTPLIDCLLFLIIFFMLSTTFTKASKLQINLPEAKGEAQAPAASKAVEVAVGAGGEYAVNGQPLLNRQANALRSAIEREAGEGRDIGFIIVADGKAPHQAVVTVMDVAGQMGFVNLSISTRTPQADTSP